MLWAQLGHVGRYVSPSLHTLRVLPPPHSSPIRRLPRASPILAVFSRSRHVTGTLEISRGKLEVPLAVSFRLCAVPFRTLLNQSELFFYSHEIFMGGRWVPFVSVEVSHLLSEYFDFSAAVGERNGRRRKT